MPHGDMIPVFKYLKCSCKKREHLFCYSRMRESRFQHKKLPLLLLKATDYFPITGNINEILSPGILATP